MGISISMGFDGPILFLLFLGGLELPLPPNRPTGTITGTVTDPSGASATQSQIAVRTWPPWTARDALTNDGWRLHRRSSGGWPAIASRGEQMVSAGVSTATSPRDIEQTVRSGLRAPARPDLE